MYPVESNKQNCDAKTAAKGKQASYYVGDPVPENWDDDLTDEEETAQLTHGMMSGIEDEDEVSDVPYASSSSQRASGSAQDGGHRRQKKRNNNTKSKPSTITFSMHKSKDFVPGRILKMYWSEPAGSHHQNSSTDAINHSATPVKIWRFVIIETRLGHSTCIPIHTYNYNATLKRGCYPQDHAMIYFGAKPPAYKPGENIPHPKIKASGVSGEQLDPTSRINFSKKYTIQHNFLLQFIGQIHKESANDFWATLDKVTFWPESQASNAAQPGPHTDARSDDIPDESNASPSSIYTYPHATTRLLESLNEPHGKDAADAPDSLNTVTFDEILEEANFTTCASDQDDSADGEDQIFTDSESQDGLAVDAEEQPLIFSERDMLTNLENEEDTEEEMHWFYKVQTASNSDALPQEPRVGDPLINEGTQIIVASGADSRMSLHALGIRHRTGFAIVAARPDVGPRPVLPLHNLGCNGYTTHHSSSISTAHRETEEDAATVSAKTVGYYFTFCILLFAIIGTLGIGVQAITVVNLLKEESTVSYMALSWWDNNFLQTLSGSCWQVLGMSFTVALTLRHVSEHNDRRDWIVVWSLCGVCLMGSLVSIGVYKMSPWSSHFMAGVASLAQVYVHFLTIRILQKVEVRQKIQKRDIVDLELEKYRGDGTAKIDDELRGYEMSMQVRRDRVFEAIILLEKRKTELEIDLQGRKRLMTKDSAYGSGGEVTDESRSSDHDSVEDGGCL